jgi:hypothetical protein
MMFQKQRQANQFGSRRNTRQGKERRHRQSYEIILFNHKTTDSMASTGSMHDSNTTRNITFQLSKEALSSYCDQSCMCSLARLVFKTDSEYSGVLRVLRSTPCSLRTRTRISPDPHSRPVSLRHFCSHVKKPEYE